MKKSLSRRLLILLAALLVTTFSFSKTGTPNPEERSNLNTTEITDEAFEQALLSLGIDSEGVLNGYIYTSDAALVTGLLDLSDRGISDLSGIEAFTNMTQLDCSSNEISYLDLSQNTALTSLNCSDNSLVDLDLSQNTALTTLDCSVNQLTNLDLSQNTALTTLNCSDNQLDDLNLSQNTALTSLNCSVNQLTNLNLLNGNNLNIPTSSFDATDNMLSCINVDDPAYSTTNWTNIDAEVDFDLTCIYTDIPDANFEAKLIALGVDKRATPNGKILNSEAEAVTDILNVSSSAIEDLTGIEAFVNLTRLWCYSNDLTSLNVSANTALTQLWCYSNQLTSLDVSTNTVLNYLYCSSNQLTNLDVNTNPLLENLLCDANQLTSLDVSANTALTRLDCPSNQLTSLDLSTNTLLNTLYCHNNQLTSLDVSTNTALTSLGCSTNPLTNLNLNQNTNLQSLNCSSTQLTVLDMSTNTALEYLVCSSNQLTSLDVSMNSALTTLYCNNNQLTNLNVKNGNNSNTSTSSFNATANSLSCITVDDPTYSTTNWTSIDAEVVFDLTCNYTAIPDANFEAKLIALGFDKRTTPDDRILNTDAAAVTGLLEVSSSSIADLSGIEAFVNLTQLSCHTNQLTSLEISMNTALIFLNCHTNQLTSLDVSMNTALQFFYCFSNQLTSLDVSMNTALTRLYCQSNQLTSLDLSTNTALMHLWCHSNQLTSLDVSTNPALDYLRCSSNQLTSLDVSTNPLLENLICHSNQLTNLDVSVNTALTRLDCFSNQLTSLDLSTNTLLNTLYCFSNQLTNLDIKNGNNSNMSNSNFNATSNSLSCIKVDDPIYSSTNWTGIDAGVSFSTHCLCPDPSLTVPTAADASITSDATCTDASGWTHFYNSTSDKILLSLEIASSGAVIPDNAVTLDPDGATDVMWVPAVSGNFVDNTDGAAFMKRKWDVAPTTQPTSPVGVRFYYTTEEYDAVNTEISNHSGTPLAAHTEMRFFKVLDDSDPFDVGSLLFADGIDLGHGTASTTAWTYSAFGIDHFAEFYVDGFSGGGGGGASGGAALPIELLYIKGEALEKDNKIIWASSTESNTEYHVIERSVKGSDDWEEIGKMDAAGFSIATIEYEFLDESPATVAYYRVKTIDFDGSISISKVVAIERKRTIFEVLSVYPTPAQNEVSVDFYLLASSSITLTLTDVSGQVMVLENYEGSDGTNRLCFDLSRFQAGMYFLQIDNGAEKLLSRIVKY